LPAEPELLVAVLYLVLCPIPKYLHPVFAGASPTLGKTEYLAPPVPFDKYFHLLLSQGPFAVLEIQVLPTSAPPRVADIAALFPPIRPSHLHRSPLDLANHGGVQFVDVTVVDVTVVKTITITITITINYSVLQGKHSRALGGKPVSSMLNTLLDA
jgi:hypothetical protein